MKKGIITLFALTVLVLGGMLLFSRLVEGSDLLYDRIDELKGRPVYQDQRLPAKVLIDGDQAYMTLEDMNRYLGTDLRMDEEKQLMVLTLSSNTYQFENAAVDEFVKQEELVLTFNFTEIEEEPYVSLKDFETLLGFKVDIIEETGIVTIDPLGAEVKEGTLIKEAYLMDEPVWWGKRLSRETVGQNLRVYNEKEDYYYVRTDHGYFAYVPKKSLEVTGQEERGELLAFPVLDSPILDGKLVLTWDHVSTRSKDRREQEKNAAIDIYSPTWFDLMDSKGNLENRGDFTYARDAKQKGYFLWGLVTNSFDPAMTSEFLGDEAAQDRLIRQLLVYSGLYELDGINIDFENVYYADRDRLTAFVKRLTDQLHQNGLVVSMDITVPSSSLNWSQVYDRASIGQIVDYVAVMTYDEHWAASPVSGSVASIGWVERGLQRTLELIPAEKVLLGVPFYTRIWEETVLSSGVTRVTSKAYGMEQVQTILEEHQAAVWWDETAGQYYAEYVQDGNTYRVWIESSESLALKINLVEKYGLAGVAAWRKDFETEDVWQVFEELP